MPSVDASALPHGSVDGCAPTDEGWLVRQARRVLVLAGLVVGCWLLASLVHGAHASAAPVPAIPSAQTSGTAASVTHLVRSVQHSAETVVNKVQPTQPVLADLPTSVGTLSGTVQATTDTVAGTAHLVSTTGLQIVSPTRAVLTLAKPSAGSAAVPMSSAVAVAQSRGAAPVTVAAAQATASHATAEASSTSRPAGPQRPLRSPSPADSLLGAGGFGTSQTSGGSAATSLRAAACAPDPFLMAALSSHTAAQLRTAAARPSVSPD